VRFRYINIRDISPQGFGGTWTFGGGIGPVLDANDQVVTDPNTGLPVLTQLTSIERYRRTLLFQQLAMTAPQIRALGGGATQFSISAGNPLATVSQFRLRRLRSGRLESAVQPDAQPGFALREPGQH